MVNKNVVVVAFDGLDYELIEEFGLKNIPQKEFGKIDNTSEMDSIVTSELFASFITGSNYRRHGIEGLKKYPSIRKKIIDFLAPEYLANNLRGFQRLKNTLKTALDAEGRPYSKEDLKKETLFETIDNSRAMFIPSYNPSILWDVCGIAKPLEKGYKVKENVEFWETRELRYRKKALDNEFERIGARPLLMVHFHYPDVCQHMYGDVDLGINRRKLKSLYEDVDSLAGEIKSKAEEAGYDTIIFMSDHGLPEGKGHNENAFYSSNQNLFSKKPKITDFFGLLNEMAGSK